ncbi:class I SAM-dependent methyltransferase [Flavobacteriaceae bacterium]|nr:class I SAM-dependent methyltransferase [Flavobacteriaceae bacterium]MDB2695241.1 class I SAM-dependent methyltransferase [Flavobacteriaceae bacterium]MDC6478610.1 class I SAM-dependent methyltransferase [Flavobacteriaceae bacterium]
MKKINKCRISGESDLVDILSLGEQYLTGVFPSSKEEKVTKGPLDLVWAKESGLLQLKHSYDLGEMYGDNYGYRSGLNSSMVEHLTNKITSLENLVQLNPNDIVIDVGSNDATSLKAYSKPCIKVGIDPTGMKFKEYYSDDITLIPDFFTKELFINKFHGKKAKIVTSIAMFYDLEDPKKFAKDIYEILDDNGIWHFEQSYMPSMLKTNAYDTICHEHLEFYSLKVVKELLESVNLKIIDVQTNSINGGSFAVTASRADANYNVNDVLIDWMLFQEGQMKLDTISPYLAFKERIFEHRDSLRKLILSLVKSGKKVYGYGASTKGNVLLQFCEFTSLEIPFIAEVNEEKFGKYTPGTHIKIISEEEAKMNKPDYFLVLPWHFKNNILSREKEYLKTGVKFIFPLPEIEII